MSRPETISLLAGGWSVKGLDLNRLPGLVIAVNDAAVRAPRVDVAVSMDRLWTEYRWDALKARAGPTWVRRAATKNVSGTWKGLVTFDCDHASNLFTEEAQGFALNGTHSGFCALNLAYRMRPQRLVLFGYDHRRGPGSEAYWFPDYPWSPKGATTGGKYLAWARQYALAADAFRAAGVEVLNASQTSAITNFTKIDPAKVLECGP